MDGTAPVGAQIRAGGMVETGSVSRGEALDVSFVLTDFQGSNFTVVYSGILPDLFREGQGVIVEGRLQDDGGGLLGSLLDSNQDGQVLDDVINLAKKLF